MRRFSFPITIFFGPASSSSVCSVPNPLPPSVSSSHVSWAMPFFFCEGGYPQNRRHPPIQLPAACFPAYPPACLQGHRLKPAVRSLPLTQNPSVPSDGSPAVPGSSDRPDPASALHSPPAAHRSTPARKNAHSPVQPYTRPPRFPVHRHPRHETKHPPQPCIHRILLPY